MEDSETIVVLLLALWQLVTNRANHLKRIRKARQQRLKKLLKTVQELAVEDKRIRAAKRRRLLMLLDSRRRRKPSIWAFNRASEWWDIVVPSFSNAQWVQNFRMSKETLDFLCIKLRPIMECQDTSFRVCVPLKKRVAIALWKLATGSEYRSIGHLFGVSITTVCRCVQDFCDAANTVLVPEQIRCPTEEKFREIAAYNENRWGVPHCVGAIDGSHIPIIAPQDYHCDYFNRKGWHSIILQGVVDGKGLFWNVFAGLPGSLHDARVLRLSNLWELADRGSLFPAHTREIGGVTAGYYLLGDSAYPLRNWLLKPFQDTGRLTDEQQLFNRKFSRGQVVVENAFGRLKGRWRCLLKRNDSDTELVKSMVLACCALHNLCENHGETYVTEWDTPVATVEPVVAVAQGVDEGGRDVREGLMRHFLSNV